MRTFGELNRTRKKIIRERFVLPEDTSKVEVNDHNVPFERVSGALVGCTVRNDNFHLHENKAKQF